MHFVINNKQPNDKGGKLIKEEKDKLEEIVCDAVEKFNKKTGQLPSFLFGLSDDKKFCKVEVVK